MSHHYHGPYPPPNGSSSQRAPLPYQPSLYPTLSSPSTSAQLQAPAYSYYVPRMTAVSVSVTPALSSYQPNLTYIANHIYQAPVAEPIQVFKPSGDIEWIPAIPCTASHLTGKAVIGGYEGDGSPLWVIRAKVNGSLIPGKFSVRDNTALVTYLRKEVHVQNIEVLCARPETLQWVRVNNGSIPPNAIVGGKAVLGTTLYVGRAGYQKALVPGKVNARTKCCYIGLGGSLVSLRYYEVLCRIK